MKKVLRGLVKVDEKISVCFRFSSVTNLYSSMCHERIGGALWR